MLAAPSHYSPADGAALVSAALATALQDASDRIAAGSAVRTLVVPARQDLEMARQARELIAR